MRECRRRVRTLAGLLLLLVAVSTWTPAPCSMRMATPADAGDHGCCAEGVSAPPPPCCHAQSSTPASAILAGKPGPTALPPAVFLAAMPATITSATVFHSPAVPHLHSPPPAVLRI